MDMIASLKGDISAIEAGESDIGADPEAVARKYADAFGQDIRITVIDDSGNVVADTQSDPAALGNHNDRPEVIAARNGGFGTDARESVSTGQDTVYVAKQSGDVVLRLSRPMENTAYFVNQALPVMIITFVALTIVALFFSGMLAQGALAPMHRMHEYIQAYMDGKTADFKINSKYEELDDLSKAFSHLAERLKRYIAQVKLENKKSAVILDSIQEGLMVLDEDRNVLLINNAARRVFGVDDDITNANLLHFARREEIVTPIDRAFKKHKSSSFDVVDEKTGRTYRYYLSFVAEGTFAKSGYGILVLIMDVTDIVLSERVRQDFAANVSHELKTPLTSIYGYAQLIENDMTKDDNDIKKYVGHITKEAARLVGLINDTLALSELETITIDESVETVDVKSAAREVEDMLRSKLEENGSVMEITGEAVMTANPDRIKQLLLNLCDNAVKYSKPGMNVDVTLSQEGNDICIMVGDMGIGVPDDEKDRIFERFYRAKNAGGAKVCGTGLGLAIVKHIAQLYGGEVSVKDASGGGSVFTVRMKGEV